jgi:hypothetical protein
MRNPATNTDDLRALLERLYPDIEISGTGVALLAAQIAELENRYELMRERIDHHAAQERSRAMMRARAFFPHKIDHEGKYKPNNYVK